MQITVAALTLALSASWTRAQTERNLRNQLVGTWSFVVAEVTSPDGKKYFPFGETPKGVLIFTPDGLFAQIHVASDVPRIASICSALTSSAKRIPTWPAATGQRPISTRG